MIFDLLYGAVFILGLPVWLWRLAVAKRHRHRLADRFAFYPELPPAPAGRVWFHAASLGEVRSLRGLLAELHRTRPALPWVITTQTETGWDEARRLYPAAVVLKFPLDFSWTVSRAIDRIAPSAVVLVESEFWPNFLRIASRRAIPVAVAGGAVSDRTSRRLSRFATRLLTRAVFPSMTRVWAADTEAARRFRMLGVPADRVEVCGGLKFDVQAPAASSETERLLSRVRAWKGGGVLLVAGSTHEGEEEALLGIFGRIRVQGPMRLVLAPRHPQRFAAAARLLAAGSLPHLKRSALAEGGPIGAEIDILLLDTVGELSALYREADAAFVGGSLVPVGGHNVLEPAVCGVPVAWGPHAFQFRSECQGLQAAGGGVEVADAAMLRIVLGGWLGNPEARRRAGENARRFVEENRGASARVAQGILGLLPEGRPAGRR